MEPASSSPPPPPRRPKEEEKEEVVDPKAEEEELTKDIKGKPIMGVSGFFNDATRSDQRVLDVLHAQNVWGAIVAFSDDMVANKKRLMKKWQMM